MKRRKCQTNGKNSKRKTSCESPSENGHEKNGSDRRLVPSDPPCSVCELPGPKIVCSGVCKQLFHSKCIGGSPRKKFVCSACSSGKHQCFSCKQSEGEVKNCSIASCGKFYHLECLKVRVLDKEHFVCPHHSCNTCNQNNSTAIKGDVLMCIRCPLAFHSRKECIAAGCKLLSSSFILCPEHFSPSNGMLFQSVENLPWCSLCTLGGELIHCSTCTASYHEKCLPEHFHNKNICRDCVLQKRPLCGSIVWVKIGSFRWWPARVLSPDDVPESFQKDYCAGEFPVQYFGTKEYFWTHKGRVHPYFSVQEEFFAENCKGSSGLEVKYKLSIEEANAALDKWTESSVDNKSKPRYKHIRCNRPIGNVQIYTLDAKLLPRCACDPESDNPCGYKSECINRSVLVECHPNVCPAGERCQNQMFQKRQYPKLIPFKSESRGWALKAMEDISKGSFVIEYIGDLIDEEECNRRLLDKSRRNDSNFYFLTIDKDRIIDAGPKGNFSRFLNHSCDPNCETQKWLVNGDTRVGIFAKQNICAGTELTFDYQMDTMSHQRLKCLCGTRICRGVIGVKTQHALPEIQQQVGKVKLRLKKTKQNLQQKYNPKKICFLCLKPNNLIKCDFKSCSKLYHVGCLGRDQVPSGRWQCPWHHCNTCGRLSKYMCTKCTNSFCEKHKTAENIILTSGQHFCSKHAEEQGS